MFIWNLVRLFQKAEVALRCFLGYRKDLQLVDLVPEPIDGIWHKAITERQCSYWFYFRVEPGMFLPNYQAHLLDTKALSSLGN